MICGMIDFFSGKWQTPDIRGAHYSRIPKASGVYAVMMVATPDDSNPIPVYVGMSHNLNNRFKKHLTVQFIRRAFPREYFRLIRFFTLLEEPLARRLEKTLIEQLKPLFNIPRDPNRKLTSWHPDYGYAQEIY